MISLGDVDRRPLRFPIVTALIVLANAAVFVLELSGTVLLFGWFVRATLCAGRHPGGVLVSDTGVQ